MKHCYYYLALCQQPHENDDMLNNVFASIHMSMIWCSQQTNYLIAWSLSREQDNSFLTSFLHEQLVHYQLFWSDSSNDAAVQTQVRSDLFVVWKLIFSLSLCLSLLSPPPVLSPLYLFNPHTAKHDWTPAIWAKFFSSSRYLNKLIWALETCNQMGGAPAAARSVFSTTKPVRECARARACVWVSVCVSVSVSVCVCVCVCVCARGALSCTWDIIFFFPSSRRRVPWPANSRYNYYCIVQWG